MISRISSSNNWYDCRQSKRLIIFKVYRNVTRRLQCSLNWIRITSIRAGRGSSNRMKVILQTRYLLVPFRCYLNCAPFKRRHMLLHATDLDNRYGSRRKILAQAPYDRLYTSIIRPGGSPLGSLRWIKINSTVCGNREDEGVSAGETKLSYGKWWSRPRDPYFFGELLLRTLIMIMPSK